MTKIQGLADIYKTEAGKATDDKLATAALVEANTYIVALLKTHSDAVAKDPKAA